MMTRVCLPWNLVPCDYESNNESMPPLEPRDYEFDDDKEEDGKEIYGQETGDCTLQPLFQPRGGNQYNRAISNVAAVVREGMKWQTCVPSLKWQIHVEQLLHEVLFVNVNEYTMCHGAHSELVKILWPCL